MHRIRLFLAVTALLVVVGAAPAFASFGDAPAVFAQAEELDRDAPAVTVEPEAEPPGEEAWTFRFLIPTLVGATALVVVAVVVGYGVRIRSRYRVVE